MSEQVVMRDSGLGDEGVPVADVTSGFQTPCGDKRRLESFPPNAPQRKLWKGSGENNDKESDDMRKPLWMETGCDIRRHLFKDIDWSKLADSEHRRWAILKVDTIATSPRHRCIRRFYVGDNNGDAYLEMQFYPCVA